MNTVLVTGAGGYIGSVLCQKLLNSGFKVKAVDRFFFGEQTVPEHQNLTKIKADNRKLPDNTFDDVFAVIDLAAISNDPSAELFDNATEQINYKARVQTAVAAKKSGVQKYVLASSASVYGYQKDILNESAPVNPLTTYAKANHAAEMDILPLASDAFCATVIRQATVYGLSPRMRFDLAVNGMTYGCWKERILPLMRDGNQYRPMVHVQDTTDVMLKLLTSDPIATNGEVFNVGSNIQNFKIVDLAEEIVEIVSSKTGKKIDIEWYGDPDHRSYRLEFNKIESTLQWKANYGLKDGVTEIIQALESGGLDKTLPTITLKWYRELHHWHNIIKQIELHGGILDIE